MITFHEAEFENFGRCLWIENGAVEAVVSLDVGPRVLRFAFTGGRNLLRTEPERATRWSGPQYDAFYGAGSVSYAYGGHRLWVTPERAPQTYYPDNAPVAWEKAGQSFRFMPPPQRENGIALTLTLEMDPHLPRMTAINGVKNVSDEEKELAVWSVTAMDLGGTAMLRQSEDATGFLPNRTVSLWAYTDPADERLTLTKKYLTVRQDPAVRGAAKIGINDRAGRAVYRLGEDVFRRETAPHDPARIYPDGGVSSEIYVSPIILELEALGPVGRLAPGGEATLREDWSLVKAPAVPEEETDAFWAAVWQA